MIIKEVLKLKIASKRRYAIFISLAAFVVLGFTIFDNAMNPNDQAMEIFNYSIMIFTGIFGLFGTYVVIGSSIDLNALKKDKLPVVDVQFLRYNKRGISAKDRDEVVYSGQVFIDLKTSEELLLIVSNVEVNRKYKIMYGKHTNIGVVLEKI
jgi:hypothetical protein